ncbi:MAG TPA: glucosaminidase domain-containing protein [Saprospiraceae bacterium]|nr:glucosaminidase domain-containing protein [Saprospiraceae bacterium]
MYQPNRLLGMPLAAFAFAFLLFLPLFSEAQSSISSNSVHPDTLAVRNIARVVADSFGASLELLETFMFEAIAMEREEGIPASAFIGIAILESTGFTSYLFKNAMNPFGMRATRIWKGPTFMMWHEGEDSAFRKYNSPKEAVRDFGHFLHSRVWFKDAFACKDADLECFLTALKPNAALREPGYAADPEWANKVRRVIRTYGLEAL